jgi:hypothetical protein
MKSVVRGFAIAAVMLTLVGVDTARAQIIGSVEFTTAFPFTVGNASVPAGSYTITPDSDNPSIFELTGGRTAVLFEADPAQANNTPSKTEVVFKRFGEGYVLKSIWMEGDKGGSETRVAEGEKHMARRPGPTTEQRVAGLKKSAAPATTGTSGQR